MPDEPAGTLPEGAAMPKVLRSLTAHLRADQACHWVRRDETRAVRVVEDCQAANFEYFSKLDSTLFAGLCPRKYRCMFHTSGAGKSDEPVGNQRFARAQTHLSDAPE